MEKIKILNDLQKSLIRFLDELTELFPSEGDFILARIMIKDKISMVDIVKYFETFVLPFKPEIVKKNKNVIIEKIFSIGNNGISIPQQKLDRYSTIYDELSDDDRDIVWSWVDTFIGFVEKYQKLT